MNVGSLVKIEGLPVRDAVYFNRHVQTFREELSASILIMKQTSFKMEAVGFSVAVHVYYLSVMSHLVS